MPSPSGSAALTILRRNDWGFKEGCGAILRSDADVGFERITSPNGLLAETLLNPPVFHLRRLSWIRPSGGRRNTTHGSHIDRGITLTSSNS